MLFPQIDYNLRSLCSVYYFLSGSCPSPVLGREEYCKQMHCLDPCLECTQVCIPCDGTWIQPCYSGFFSVIIMPHLQGFPKRNSSQTFKALFKYTQMTADGDNDIPRTHLTGSNAACLTMKNQI